MPTPIPQPSPVWDMRLLQDEEGLVLIQVTMNVGTKFVSEALPVGPGDQLLHALGDCTNALIGSTYAYGLEQGWFIEV